MCFVILFGYIESEQFFIYFKDSFDIFYVEGVDGVVKMFSIGLYCCLIGCLGKIVGFKWFIDYV